MDREVAYHQAVLDALDQVLIPGSSNAEAARPAGAGAPPVAAHLDHAKQLRAKLGEGR